MYYVPGHLFPILEPFQAFFVRIALALVTKGLRQSNYYTNVYLTCHLLSDPRIFSPKCSSRVCYAWHHPHCPQTVLQGRFKALIITRLSFCLPLFRFYKVVLYYEFKYLQMGLYSTSAMSFFFFEILTWRKNAIMISGYRGCISVCRAVFKNL